MRGWTSRGHVFLNELLSQSGADPELDFEGE